MSTSWLQSDLKCQELVCPPVPESPHDFLLAQLNSTGAQALSPAQGQGSGPPSPSSRAAALNSGVTSPSSRPSVVLPAGPTQTSALVTASSQSYQVPFEIAYSELARQRNLRQLKALFDDADSDGSGEMSLAEFREAMKKTRFQKTFASLGVQPHQAEPVFRVMADRPSVPGSQQREMGIRSFMSGLADLVGAQPDGTGVELDSGLLSPKREAKLRRQTSPMRMDGTGSPTSAGQQAHEADRVSTAPARHQGTAVGLGLGPVHMLPELAVQRAFVHSATAKALHPATAVKRPARRTSSASSTGTMTVAAVMATTGGSGGTAAP